MGFRLDIEQGTLSPADPPWTQLPPGSRPGPPSGLSPPLALRLCDQRSSPHPRLPFWVRVRTRMWCCRPFRRCLPITLARSWAQPSSSHPPVAFFTPQTVGTTAWRSMPSIWKPASCRWLGMKCRKALALAISPSILPGHCCWWQTRIRTLWSPSGSTKILDAAGNRARGRSTNAGLPATRGVFQVGGRGAVGGSLCRWPATALAPGTPYPLGATPMDGGVNFSVFANKAHALELLLFDHADARRRRSSGLPRRGIAPTIIDTRLSGAPAWTDLRLSGHWPQRTGAWPAVRSGKGPAGSVRARRGHAARL